MKHTRWWIAGAALWGFAEATFFFIVPDLLLTAAVIALGFKQAFRLALVAAAAAVAGGVIMILWGASDAEAARAFLLGVPLIGADLLTRVQHEIAGVWPVELTLGAISGAPFKIYAVEAGAAGINPIVFALAGFVARLARFVLAIAITALGVRLAVRLGYARLAPYGLAIAWALIYGTYLVVRLKA